VIPNDLIIKKARRRRQGDAHIMLCVCAPNLGADDDRADNRPVEMISNSLSSMMSCAVLRLKRFQ
jgi:hypothetical protein